MKIMILHDKVGNIISSAIPARQFSGSLRMQLQSGEHMIEVDSSEIGLSEPYILDEKGSRLANAVRSALQKLKVDVKHHKLVAKRIK
jgi:hypothetical protein